jgi:hypothetical protein
MTYGESEEDALVQAKDALNGCLAADVAQGNMPIYPSFKGPGSHAIDVDLEVELAIENGRLILLEKATEDQNE